MNPENEIRALIEQSKTTPGSNAEARILGDAWDLLEKRQLERTQGFAPGVWRKTMHSKTGKLAAAAVIILAVVLVFQFLGGSLGTSVTFAQVIEPIFKARTAEFDIIVGDEKDPAVPIIHDMVMGSRIRRTVQAVDDSVNIIDLEAGRMLSYSEKKKEARYTALEGLPSIGNYMEQLQGVLVMLQESPHFVVEDLGSQRIDGHEVVGFLAKHPQAEITVWADAKTGLPVRIEHIERQMRVICRNMKFDVPMEEAWFSMEVPEGYTLHEEGKLDLTAGTEEAFIDGLRLMAETFNDGRFPEGVAVEDYLKQAPNVAQQIESMKLSAAEEMALGQTIQNYLLFTRIFQGQGKWTYRGQGVQLGDAETPIFWYQPQDSQTFRVIYGDLHVEDVAPENLPQ